MKKNEIKSTKNTINSGKEDLSEAMDDLLKNIKQKKSIVNKILKNISGIKQKQ